MAVPKSQKLLWEEAATKTPEAEPIPVMPAEQELGPVKIREVPCLNEFVAVLRFRHQSALQMPDSSKYKNEGVVVGIGPGLPGNDGSRCPTQLKLGDVVMFLDRNVVTELEPRNGPYQGQKVAIISERSLLCKLPPVPFEIIEAKHEEPQTSD